MFNGQHPVLSTVQWLCPKAPSTKPQEFKNKSSQHPPCSFDLCKDSTHTTVPTTEPSTKAFFCISTQTKCWQKKCQVKNKFQFISSDTKYKVCCVSLCTHIRWPNSKEQKRWYLPSLSVPESKTGEQMYNGETSLPSVGLGSAPYAFHQTLVQSLQENLMSAQKRNP